MAQTVGAFSSSAPDYRQGVVSRMSQTSASAAMPTSSSNAVVFNFAPCSAAMIYVDAACTITWYVAASEVATVAAAYDDASTPVALTQSPGAAGWYAVPAKLFAAPAISPVASSGTPNFRLSVKK